MYIVWHDDSYSECPYSIIEKEEELKIWMKDGSIRENDIIYKVIKKYKVICKKELKIIKMKEVKNDV
jgi:hypothetical protein